MQASNTGGPAIITADRPDVLIVGAGMVGLGCALEIRELGARVEVLESATAGAGASSAAAGMLAPGTESIHHPELGRVGAESRDLWRSWVDRLGGDSQLGYEEAGSLFPTFGSEGDDFLSEVRRAATSIGDPVEEYTREELRRAFPYLCEKVGRAVRLPREYQVDPGAVVGALVKALRRKGTLVHRKRCVRSITYDREGVQLLGDGWSTRADKVVVATGAWSNRLEGLPSMVTPIRGQMIAFADVDCGFSGAVRGPSSYLLSRGTEVLVGATIEDVGFDQDTTAEARDQLSEFATRLFPKLRWKRTARQWAGLRPKTRDEMPVVGRWQDTSLYLATGHYRNGVLLAPWTADRIASLVSGSSDAEVPASFSPNRFAG